MSASAPATETCASCGTPLPDAARFCPSCGASIDAGSTVRAEVPVHETGQVPVSFQHAEPRWFGVAPPHLLLALAVVVLVLSLVLFATGHWPYGLILLGVSALLVAAFLEAARRRPSAGVTRASVDARERAQSAWETWRVRSYATSEARRIRSSLMLLESQRRTVLLDLGEAAHRGDAATEGAIRAHLVELDQHEAYLAEELDRALSDAGERIRKARLPVQDTVMVIPPEPYPPPGEATPPQPAVVPEPYPPPNEADPPQPAIVPEPSPDQPGPNPEP